VKVIPAIDLKDGKCVRLFQGDFEQTTEYSSDPAAVAQSFAELNTRDLHIVDLDGARSGKQHNRKIIRAMAEGSTLSIQLGGGIRSEQALTDWFDAGVTRCVVGSLAVADPDAVRAWLARFGGERLVLALDVKLNADGQPRLTTHGWTRESTITLFDCIDTFIDVGLEHVLCTDVSRDGAMTGPNIQLYRSVMRRYPELLLQASGGVRNIGDLEALREAGIPAAITGRALLEGAITPEEMISFQQSA
jgi:phosphoribosylformimino-5-aminoimidazole carboxamide ribotide isomerase